jgi:AraC-like DNA-binding protein
VVAEVAERVDLAVAEAVLRDRNRGMSVAQVCAKWEISSSTLHRRIQQALEANKIDDINEFRAREIAAMDDLASRWEEQLVIAQELANFAVEAKDAGAIQAAAKIRADALNGLLKVRERRARLAGADAPVKADVTVVHHDAKDLELARMVAEAKREHTVA